MNFSGPLRTFALAGVAVAALVGCSDTTISSPGAPEVVPSPPPPPPATPTSTIQLVPAAGCPTGLMEVTLEAVAADGFSSIDVCGLGSTGSSTNLTSDITIQANTTVALLGPVFVGQDGGTTAKLTIEEGVRFFGGSEQGTANATDDYLVVARGSQIIANGTASAPIRFTARGAMNDEETGSNLIGDSDAGLWGGLVINGFGPINDCSDSTVTGGSADCTKSGEGASGLFGGADANDSSGTLNYVVVEYAGSRLTNDDELNGIAFQGVGAGTDVDFIQVHNNLDDGIEWFGGTVEVKHAVVTGAGDDSIDWTDGWSGGLQFAVIKSDNPSSGDPRGIEADNQRPNDLTPFSDPTIANFTLLGSAGNQQGILLRRGTKGRIINGVVVDYGSGLDIDDQQTLDNLANGDLEVTSLFLDTPENFTADSSPLTLPAGSVVVEGNNSLVDGFFPGQAERNVVVQQPSAGETFFEATDAIGAFSTTETLASNWASFATAGTLFEQVDASCPTGTTDAGTITVAATSTDKTLCQITASFSSDLRLSNGDQIVYEIVSPVFVGVDLGPDPAAPLAGGVSATLTIDAGVTVVAEGNDDYLVITRGSKIVSNGTANAPVVFTAKGVLDGTITTDDTTKGIWGGLVINGRAPINDCADATATGGTVGCEKSGEGSSGLFGGATSDDDSGQLFYTRVEYAGTRLTNDDELNGIAFQAVGSATEASFLQVYNNLDDCFEWFGGTISVDHVIGLGCGDDSLDWTDGWQGSLQYAIVYPGEGDMSGDPRGIEGDNQRPNDLAPFSMPRVSNFTIINSGDAAVDAGAVLRRGMKGTVVNGIIVGFDDGIDVDDAQTFTNIGDSSLVVDSLFLDNANNFRADSDGSITASATVVEGTNTLSGTSFRAGREGVVPGDNENAVGVFDVTGIGDLEATTYIGAVENASDTWFAGWAVDEDGNVIN